jgi:hypothetical protein
MKNIETRKTIALSISAAYILFSGYCIITGSSLPDTFVAIVGLIIGYYFGKSTALDIPKKM